ncbi:phosphopantothenoylcysteine decarboxylase [Hydrogenophaga sp. PAMC20947]|uniref:phosphopantothenoylcysteine decarboxylase domain-containing protein n=1 Tax=Hydrogenophaga sp. PAMC20947 TaxID=2565558 RepID=UPI00109E2827|nr:phosphopantothenoylcysteine decarboxylase [Hydrogenophaga sp. PAMC20947]QCB45023.1 phosphopantothenoylcysteine decarboxylase [Hydrogenophaga sp. PAMC20947]
MSRYDWDFSAPTPSPMGDHDVPMVSQRLAGRRIALLVTGGIAAMKTPQLARGLRRHGAEVVAFASDDALRYVAREALEWATCAPVVTGLTWAAEHLSDGAPFDAYLVAPATHNTIAKMACGIADTVVTSALASALGRMEQGRTRIVVAPTMHGTLHNSVLVDNARKLAGIGVQFVAPHDAYGKHNLPSTETLCIAVGRALSDSPLAGRHILVTAGPTPVPIDGVRRIVNRFRGRLGADIADELIWRGAEAELLLGDGAWRPSAPLPLTIARTFDEYRDTVVKRAQGGLFAGVFSAGVADYRPRQAVQGKIPSGQASLQLDLEPTEKVIDLACAADPAMACVAFKYLEGVSEAELLQVAARRLGRASLVVATRGEDTRGSAQRAFMVQASGVTPMEGKQQIAAFVADHLEGLARR